MISSSIKYRIDNYGKCFQIKESFIFLPFGYNKMEIKAFDFPKYNILWVILSSNSSLKTQTHVGLEPFFLTVSKIVGCEGSAELIITSF